jgi:hypothetical protein
MYSVFWSYRTVALVFVVCLSSQAALAQAVKLTTYEADSGPRAFPPLAANGCAGAERTVAEEVNPGRGAANDGFVPCDNTPINVMPVNPCSPASLGRPGCNAPKDLVAGDLGPMGKAGQTILRAREKVLEILQTGNGCSDWFRRKDPNPAATFRTLDFVLDRKGQEHVLESRDVGPLEVFRSPYVARVYQGEGSYGTITLNTRGAFFFGLAMVMEVGKDGGPGIFQGYRPLYVGPYSGNTLHAQVATLLHEFGHLLDLLPIDEGDQDGKSVQNTYEVLHYCRAEVEAKVKRGTMIAVK